VPHVCAALPGAPGACPAGRRTGARTSVRNPPSRCGRDSTGADSGKPAPVDARTQPGGASCTRGHFEEERGTQGRDAGRRVRQPVRARSRARQAAHIGFRAAARALGVSPGHTCTTCDAWAEDLGDAPWRCTIASSTVRSSSRSQGRPLSPTALEAPDALTVRAFRSSRNRHLAQLLAAEMDQSQTGDDTSGRSPASRGRRGVPIYT
jgi:hypothetical protein